MLQGGQSWGGGRSSSGSDAIVSGLMLGFFMWMAFAVMLLMAAGAVLVVIGVVALLAFTWRRIVAPALEWCVATFPIPSLVVACVAFCYGLVFGWQHVAVPALSWISHHPATFRADCITAAWSAMWLAVCVGLVFLAIELKDAFDELNALWFGLILFFACLIVSFGLFVTHVIPASVWAQHAPLSASTHH